MSKITHVDVRYDVSVPMDLLKAQAAKESKRFAGIHDIDERLKAEINAGLDVMYRAFIEDDELPDGIVAKIHEGIRFDDEYPVEDETCATVVFSFEPAFITKDEV